MQSRSQLISGGLLALFFLLIVIGAFANVLAEGGFVVAQYAITTSITTVFSTTSPSITVTSSPTSMSTPVPSPTNCHPPQEWTAITLLPGDTLESLADLYLSSPEMLSDANCLIANTLVPGTIFYVPTLPTSATPSETFAVVCGPPDGWILYTVQSGDNLFKLGIAFGVSIKQLQFANCMGNSTFLRTGTLIFVPDVVTRTPSPSTIASH